MNKLRKISFDASFALTVSVMLATSIIIGLFIIALDLLGLEWSSVLRDRSVSTEPLAGLVSNIGIVLMATAGIVAAAASLPHANQF